MNIVYICEMNEYEPENLNEIEYLIMLCSTYVNGTPPKNAIYMYNWLKDAIYDMRISKQYLPNIKFTIFGCGNSLYEENLI